MSGRILQILDAIRSGDVSFVTTEVTRTNANFIDPASRLSLLMWAVAAGQLPCLLLLLSRGASILPVDRLGFTVLHRAAWYGTVAMLRALLFVSPDTRVVASGASTSTSVPLSGLQEGSWTMPYGSSFPLSTSDPLDRPSQKKEWMDGKQQRVERYSHPDGEEAGQGRELSSSDDVGKLNTLQYDQPLQQPPIRWREGAQRLVNAVQPLTGRTALMLSAVRGNAQMVDFLIDVCGADMYFRDHEGATAFDLAAMCGHLDVLRVFLAKADGDGFGHCFPFLQQQSELFGESAKTVRQRELLSEMNRMMSADFSRQSFVSAS